MIYNEANVFTAVTADKLSVEMLSKGLYGYFAHDVASLRKAIENDKTSRYCLYGRLTSIKDDSNRARFVLDRGDFIFSLFYPTDDYLNQNRY